MAMTVPAPADLVDKSLGEAALRRIVLRAGARCAYCGDPATSIDHVWPRKRGGTNDLFNLVPACKPCNSTKRDQSWLKDECESCGVMCDPIRVDCRTGLAWYGCGYVEGDDPVGCGRRWTCTWDLQRVSRTLAFEYMPWVL